MLVKAWLDELVWLDGAQDGPFRSLALQAVKLSRNGLVGLRSLSERCSSFVLYEFLHPKFRLVLMCYWSWSGRAARSETKPRWRPGVQGEGGAYEALREGREHEELKPPAKCRQEQQCRQKQQPGRTKQAVSEAVQTAQETPKTWASASFPRSVSHSKEQGNQMQQRRRREQKIRNMSSSMRFAASGKNNRQQEMLFMPAASVCKAKSGAVKTCGNKEAQ